MNPWWVYIIRCKNRTLYTGITTDVEKRFEQHSNQKGAKYLKGKGPLKLEFKYEIGSRSLASKVEKKIKSLNKTDKESLIQNPNLIAPILESLTP